MRMSAYLAIASLCPPVYDIRPLVVKCKPSFGIAMSGGDRERDLGRTIHPEDLRLLPCSEAKCLEPPIELMKGSLQSGIAQFVHSAVVL